MLDFRDFWVKYLATNSYVPSLKRSQEIECSMCLERVLAKIAASERKFGLLSECDHPFCITCIRFWRNSSPTYGINVNSTLRACPICRNSYSGITEIVASFSLYCVSYIIKFILLELAKIPLTFLSFMNSYEDLKPPSSPSPSSPGNSREESLETSTPVDGVPHFIDGNGSLAEDVQEELIFYHSPFPVYEDLKPPTSLTPTTPNSLATSMASDGAESQTASLSNNGPVESMEA